MKTATTESQEFGTPEKVVAITETMQTIEDRRAMDRAKINTLFNGSRPYTDEEVKKFQIQINVNWGEGKRIMVDANRQMNAALLHTGRLFSCTLEAGKVDKRDEWSENFTKFIHEPVQRGRSGKKHHYLIRSRNATVCLHGIGALLWPNSFRWMPRFVPLEDLLIPTDTFCDFSNLRYFAINLYLTPGELVDMTQGEEVDKGWNKDLVANLLDESAKAQTESTPSTWKDQPEAMMEIKKQNNGWYYSDAVNKIKLRAFYYQSIDKPQSWYRHIVLREGIGGVNTDKFVYDGSDRVFAASIDNILNVQFGDSSLIAPLKYHSVRGLGVDLYAPVETTNRLRCEFVQSVFEHLKMYFKIQDPADRDRLKSVVLQQYGFIPEGLNIIPREQRHQVDPEMVREAMSNMRQIMQENSSGYVQDQNASSGSPITAREASIRLNQATQMISGMMQNMYLQEGFYYQEVVRRFCNPDSEDAEVKTFQEKCLKAGIPKELMKAELWNIVPERVLGGGDKSIAQAQSEWLLQHKTEYDPEAQQKILRLATSTVLEDPAKGRMFVPTAPVTATDGTFAAENVFGTLMLGIPCAMREGIDQIGYVEAMLKMMGSVIQSISQTDNVGTPQQVVGLQTCAQNVGQHIQVIAGDEQEKSRAKQYMDVLGQMANEVKGFAQRQQEAQKNQQGGEAQAEQAVAQAKIQAMTQQAQAKSQILAETSKQKLQQSEAAFQQEMQQEMQKHTLEMQSMIEQAKADMAASAMKMQTDAMIAEVKAKAAAKKPA